MLFVVIKSVVFVLVLAAAILFAQYYFSDKIALFSMGAKEVSREQAPELHEMVERLCVMADMPKPRVAIADTDVPNAFATGRTPEAAVIAVTKGIMRRLEPQELEAVLAHELSHVAHRDVAVMTIASFLGLVAGLLTRVLFYSGMFGGFGGDDRDGNGGAPVVMVVMLVSALVYVISFLLTRASVSLPGAVGRPVWRDPHRRPFGAGIRPHQDLRRHGQDPNPRPAPCGNS